MACALEPSIVVRELNMEKKELARTSSSLSTCNGLIPHVVLFLWIEFENWTQLEKKRVEMRTVESPCLIQVDQNIFRKYFVCCFFLSLSSSCRPESSRECAICACHFGNNPSQLYEYIGNHRSSEQQQQSKKGMKERRLFAFRSNLLHHHPLLSFRQIPGQAHQSGQQSVYVFKDNSRNYGVESNEWIQQKSLNNDRQRETWPEPMWLP